MYSSVPFLKLLMFVTDNQLLIVRFGLFEADLRAGELRKNGRRVKIQDLPFRALKLFLARPFEVVSREELRRAMWPEDVHLDFDRGISSTINRLREALDDTAINPRFIETVNRAGYRWIAPLQTVLSKEASDEDSPAAAAPVREVRAQKRQKVSWSLVGAVAPFLLLIGAGLLWKARHVAPKPSPQSEPVVAAVSPHIPDAETRELYLKGRYYWAKRTPDSLHQAVQYFSEAIVRDPLYAKPYVGLADSYNLLREFASMPEAEAYERAFSAASKAADLDDSSAEVHATLGFIYFWSKRNINAANREFERAIFLDPNNVKAHHWYGNVLMNEGRWSEGLAQLTRSEELNPSSASILSDKGLAMIVSGHPNEGFAVLHQLEKSDAKFISPYSYLAEVYLTQLDCQSYLAQARTEAHLSGNPAKLAIVEAARKGLAAGGCSGMLRSILNEKTKLYAQQRISAYELAKTQALLGNQAEALRYLRLSLAQSEGALVNARSDLSLAGLHEAPEFRQLIIEAGLPPLQ